MCCSFWFYYCRHGFRSLAIFFRYFLWCIGTKMHTLQQSPKAPQIQWTLSKWLPAFGRGKAGMRHGLAASTLSPDPRGPPWTPPHSPAAGPWRRTAPRRWSGCRSASAGRCLPLRPPSSWAGCTPPSLLPGGGGAWRPICLPVVQNRCILCVSPKFSPFPLNNVKHIALLSSFWPELLVWGADGLGFAMESNPRGLPACGSDVQPCLPWCRPPP